VEKVSLASAAARVGELVRAQAAYVRAVSSL
jgi:hypothetical protein